MKTIAELEKAVRDADAALAAARKAYNSCWVIECADHGNDDICAATVTQNGSFYWSGMPPTADDMRYALAEAERRGLISISEPIPTPTKTDRSTPTPGMPPEWFARQTPTCIPSVTKPED